MNFPIQLRNMNCSDEQNIIEISEDGILDYIDEDCHYLHMAYQNISRTM